MVLLYILKGIFGIFIFQSLKMDFHVDQKTQRIKNAISVIGDRMKLSGPLATSEDHERLVEPENV